MRIRVQATVYEGYSDALTGRLSDSVNLDYDLPAVPRAGDYVETPAGEYPVKTVFWARDGSVTVVVGPIFTGSESQENVVKAWSR